MIKKKKVRSQTAQAAARFSVVRPLALHHQMSHKNTIYLKTHRPVGGD